jgi:hypothetical protein
MHSYCCYVPASFMAHLQAAEAIEQTYYMIRMLVQGIAHACSPAALCSASVQTMLPAVFADGHISEVRVLGTSLN